MDHQPTWLHAEWSYRAYVRGIRYFLIGFVLALAFGLLGRSGVIGHRVPLVGVGAAFAVAAGAVIACVLGGLFLPDKKRAALHQIALLRMIAHDIFRGLPSAG